MAKCEDLPAKTYSDGDTFSIWHGGYKAAAASIAIIYLAGLLASPLGGYLSDRFGRVAVLLTASFIAGPVIYMLNIVPFGFGIGAILFMIGAILYIPQPASEAHIIGQVSGHRRSSILGIYFSGSIMGAGAITPLLGYFIDRVGFSTSFTIAGVALVVVSLTCSIWLWGNPLSTTSVNAYISQLEARGVTVNITS